MKLHLQKSLEWKGDRTGVFEMRKHYGDYFKGYPHFKDYRIKLVSLEEPEAMFQLLDEIEEKFTGIDPI